MDEMDTRAQALRFLGSFERRELRGILKTTGCALLALAVMSGPGLLGKDPYAALGPAGHATLGILVFAAALWVNEAMPAFAVALLVICPEIAGLGRPGGQPAGRQADRPVAVLDR